MKNLFKIIIVIYMFILGIVVAIMIPSVSRLITEYMYRDAPILLSFFILFIVMFSVLLLYTIRFYEKDKEKENHSMIKLNDKRSYLEQKINELNEKLASTEENWVEMNHLILPKDKEGINKSAEISPELFLKNYGIVLDNINIENDLIFILTPFHKDHYKTYDIMKKTCEKLQMKVFRGDEQYIKNDIFSHIIKCIVKSKIIIANIDGRNPNVFYELGIARVLNKPIILVGHVNSKIPFDLKQDYIILYNSEDDLERKLMENVMKILLNDQLD